MVDSCRITRPSTAAPGRDDSTGQTTPAEPVNVYEGICEVQLVDVLPQREVAGEAVVVSQRAIVKLPVDGSEAVRINDDVAILTATNDARLADAKYVVRGLHHKSHATSRRLQCEEVV